MNLDREKSLREFRRLLRVQFAEIAPIALNLAVGESVFGDVHPWLNNPST
jgi:hypothetical protein